MAAQSLTSILINQSFINLLLTPTRKN